MDRKRIEMIKSMRQTISYFINYIQEFMNTTSLEIQKELSTLQIQKGGNLNFHLGDSFEKEIFQLVTACQIHPSHIQRLAQNAILKKAMPGKVYSKGYDFGKGPTNVCSYTHKGDHAIVPDTITYYFAVESEFQNGTFVLTLNHLTSDIGPTSKAAVNVYINGRLFKNGFDPRAAHETNGNKVGVWYYVSDSWVVPKGLLHSGKNTLQIAYANGGKSFYWIKDLKFECKLPDTIRCELDQNKLKESVKATTEAEITKLKVELRTCMERKLQNLEEIHAFDHLIKTLLDMITYVRKKHDEGIKDREREKREIDKVSQMVTKLAMEFTNDVGLLHWE
jgi:hypothetical protein